MIKKYIKKSPVIYNMLRKIQVEIKYILGDKNYKEYYRAVCRFFAEHGNDKLRECPYLDESSIVFELGGYKGDWINDMYEKYHCNCYAFEPVKEFCDIIAERLSDKLKVHIYNIGLGVSTNKATISISEDASSLYGRGTVGEKIEIKSFEEFIIENKIEKIDLMQINIEGGEYDLLEWMISSGYIRKIGNLQIQFHENKNIDTKNRMMNIQSHLEKTHQLVWDYRPYVWERWTIKG